MNKNSSFESVNDSHIAVIGMSCHVPEAKNVEVFWQNLCEGKECISFFTKEELLSSGVNPSLLDNPDYIRARSVLNDVDVFDASFFGFTPREVEH